MLVFFLDVFVSGSMGSRTHMAGCGIRLIDHEGLDGGFNQQHPGRLNVDMVAGYESVDNCFNVTSLESCLKDTQHRLCRLRKTGIAVRWDVCGLFKTGHGSE